MDLDFVNRKSLLVALLVPLDAMRKTKTSIMKKETSFIFFMKILLLIYSSATLLLHYSTAFEIT
jgi:hypothetical protein